MAGELRFLGIKTALPTYLALQFYSESVRYLGPYSQKRLLL